VALGCKYGVPALRRAGGGSIINTASFVALVGCSVPQDAYTASKGAVIALTRSLAVQFGPHGIRSNAICPGPIETPLMTTWLLTNPEARAIRLARNPIGRFGKHEDIAHLALYLDPIPPKVAPWAFIPIAVCQDMKLSVTLVPSSFSGSSPGMPVRDLRPGS
jgi:NAD(P)-dependent dehydrogenase (short-subunit alcohol dehydrogenase family)